MTKQADLFVATLAACPLVAILRGIKPEEAQDIGNVLVDAGFRMMEVPLNSPDPFRSIATLAQKFGSRAIVGAGTVLTEQEVDRVAEAGGSLIVSPNSDPAVIARTAAKGMISLPGYQTPTEAFAALAAGASGLKMFPAEAASPVVLKAHRAVLPKDCPVFAVGGITADNMGDWHQAGANGFGIGSALYRPGMSASNVSAQALAFVSAWKSLTGSD